MLHDPTVMDNDGMTVAMHTANHGYNVPIEWYHDPELRNKEGDTFCMISA